VTKRFIDWGDMDDGVQLGGGGTLDDVEVSWCEPEPIGHLLTASGDTLALVFPERQFGFQRPHRKAQP
jgi:hypothetical protein